MENNQPFVYTDDQLMARLKFFIGVCLALTLTGIVFVVLYSIIFVTQPLNAISPIDQKFFELIIPIATFLTGTLSGIMLAGGDKDAQAAALKAANAGWDKPPAPLPPAPLPPAPTPSQPTQQFSSFTPVVTNSAPAQVIVGFGGKPAPVQPPHPEI